jgi:hypothetical protein
MDIGVRQRVRLLDISVLGVLMGCNAVLPVGTEGRLRAGLGTGPFDVGVHVQREQAAVNVGAEPRTVGATFVSMDAMSRRSLEQFLGRASE